jgi:hypothetical protein
VLGRFLEFSVPTENIVESLGFYKSLGFRELKTGDVWPHKYAVVSDGEINIGLHEASARRQCVTFVHQDLARSALSMADHGFDFDYLHVDEDQFNRLGFSCRDGHLVSMIEARTFSRPDENTDDSVCGRWLELTLPVKDSLRAGRFWAPLAPNLLRMREEPTTHMRFDAAGLPIGLSESIALTGPSLCFCCDDPDAVWITLAKHNLSHKEFPGYEGAFMVINAPEGTPIYLFHEDFLGELYEVEEVDEVPAD